MTFLAITAITAMMDSALTSSEKAVATAYAMYASKDGKAWPALETAAKRASLSPRGARNVRDRLAAAGFLVEDKHSRRRTRMYSVCPLALTPRDPKDIDRQCVGVDGWNQLPPEPASPGTSFPRNQLPPEPASP